MLSEQLAGSAKRFGKTNYTVLFWLGKQKSLKAIVVFCGEIIQSILQHDVSW